MSKIIGIDLGTTNSCVSVMEGNEPWEGQEEIEARFLEIIENKFK